MLIKDVPIIESNKELEKCTQEEVIKLLNQGIMFDIKDVASRKPQPVGMFMNARYNEEDNTYYGNIYLKNVEYQKFKQVNHKCIYNDENGKLEFITFYIKKID